MYANNNVSKDSSSPEQTFPCSSVSEFMKRSRKERTAHIDLTTPCELGTFSQPSRGGAERLLNLLNLENDLDNWTNSKVHRCHACENGRHKGECGNPRHIYLGTASENSLDIEEEVRIKRGRKAISARKEWKPHPNREKFMEDVRLNPDLLAIPSRKLGKMYGVAHFTIQKWKRRVYS